MAGLAPDPESDKAFWTGVKNGARYLVEAVIGFAGLFTAAAAPDRVGYACGLGIFAVAVIALFREIDRVCDGAPATRLSDLLISDFAGLAVGLPILAAVPIAGLFLAQAADGAVGYYAGLGLTGGAVAVGFLSLKACFDRAEEG